MREQALRLVEEELGKAQSFPNFLAALADDPSPRVRFQLAVTLGASDAPERMPILAEILRKPDCDSWTQTMVFAACGKQAPALLGALVDEASNAGFPSTEQRLAMRSLARLAGGTASDQELVGLIRKLTPKGTIAGWQLAVVEALAEGMRGSGRALASLRESKPFFERAVAAVRNEKTPLADRVGVMPLLSYAAFDDVKALFAELLSPREAPELQLAVVRAVTPMTHAGVAPLLLERWAGYSPTVRRECAEALFARSDRLLALLDAIEKKQVLPNQIEPARLALLKKHSVAAVRERAEKVLAGTVMTSRQKVIDAYQSALELKAERARGKAVFKKTCATCHRLENEGHQVGADLLAGLKNKTREQLLIDILDPSREVDPRFQNYQVITTKGQTMTGILATETASSITLKRGEGAEDVLLRSQIEQITATGLSLMPDGLEMQLTKQDVADLIEYLLQVAR